LDVGPVDAIIYDVEGRVSREPKIAISEDAGRLRDWLDAAHSLYLNPYYQPDPSLWTQEACNNFNSGVDSLLALLQRELDSDYEILDQQVRYAEDPGLGEYLAANSEISAIEDIRGPMVRHGLPRSCKRDGR
jgi:hypothetical protein